MFNEPAIDQNAENGLDERGESKETFADKAYEKLVELEVTSTPDPYERIPSGIVKPSDAEYQLLIDAGADPQEISSGRITRHILLSAGFVFNNYPFAHVEKPLINVVIDGVNYGKRKFLTSEELVMLKAVQRAHPETYGGDEIAEDDFRKDVLSMLSASNFILPHHIENKVNFLRVCANEFDFPYESVYATPSIRKAERDIKIGALYKKLWKEYSAANLSKYENPARDEEEFIAENCSDILNWEMADFSFYNLNIRGCKGRFVPSRNNKLDNIPSPFLNSGFHFGKPFRNPDFTVVGRDGKPFRVNMMVLHLLSEGLSEMGDYETQDGEQDYTIGRYLENLYSTDPEVRRHYLAREEVQINLLQSLDEDKLMAQVHDRLKTIMRYWTANETATPGARKLIQEIEKLERPKQKLQFGAAIRSLLKRERAA